MQGSRFSIAFALGLAFSALITGCSRKEPEQAASTSSTDTAGSAKIASASYPTRVFFGDTHLHTAMSMDAGLFGNRLGVEEAYRFALGEEVTASSGTKAKLSRPLDFLVVADHSDNMGFAPDLFAGKPELLTDPTGKRWYDMIQAGEGNAAALELIDKFSRGILPEKLMYKPGTAPYAAAWKLTVDAAEKYNKPGKFTAFIGYEWTSQVPPGNNLHRVVIYRDGGDKAGQVEPLHHVSARRQHDAGGSLESVCRRTRTRPAARCWQSHTMAISRTA